MRRSSRDLKLEGRHSRVIHASSLRLFEAVSDITRMPEWSAECYRCTWLDGDDGASVGRRFRGWSRTGVMRWSKTCEVIEAEPGRVFAFRTLATPISPSATRWRFDFIATADGTRVEQSYSVERIPPKPLMALIAVLAPHHLDLTDDLVTTLDRLDQAITR